MNRCVIIGAGEIKNYELIKKLINKDDYIVCADGGYIHADRMGLDIKTVIGDFDSSNKPEKENVIVLPKRKDVTDTFYCVDKFIKKGFDDFLLLGCLGGRFDHSYSNILLLDYINKNSCQGAIADENNYIFLATDNKIKIDCKGYKNISFFAFFEKVKALSIIGAEYTLNSYDLNVNDSLCISNNFKENNSIEITKSTGTLLVIESN